jgi:hypothetical protein
VKVYINSFWKISSSPSLVSTPYLFHFWSILRDLKFDECTN